MFTLTPAQAALINRTVDLTTRPALLVAVQARSLTPAQCSLLLQEGDQDEATMHLADLLSL